MPGFFDTLADEPRKLALRWWIFQTHLWTGVAAGIYILAISLSGSALVFREELEAAWPAEARKVQVRSGRASLEQVRSLVSGRFPDYKVAWILQPARSDLAYDVWFEK